MNTDEDEQDTIMNTDEDEYDDPYMTWQELKDIVNAMRSYELDATIRGIEGWGSVHYIQSVILDKNGDSILTLGQINLDNINKP